jgi:hypothetical protein
LVQGNEGFRRNDQNVVSTMETDWTRDSHKVVVDFDWLLFHVAPLQKPLHLQLVLSIPKPLNFLPSKMVDKSFPEAKYSIGSVDTVEDPFSNVKDSIGSIEDSIGENPICPHRAEWSRV